MLFLRATARLYCLHLFSMLCCYITATDGIAARYALISPSLYKTHNIITEWISRTLTISHTSSSSHSSAIATRHHAAALLNAQQARDTHHITITRAAQAKNTSEHHWHNISITGAARALVRVCYEYLAPRAHNIISLIAYIIMRAPARANRE